MSNKIIFLISIVIIFGGLYYFIQSQNKIAVSQIQSIPETNEVKIEGFNFSPSNIRVKLGTKITWTNLDDTQHTIKSSLFTSDLIKKNETFSYTTNTQGTYEYYCTLHPSMKGTIIVE